jgi:hypothetical protein
MKSNILGDLRAEHDHSMLDIAFFETPDYRSILEDHGKSIIVGRRGTGKSALFYWLSRQWASDGKTRLIKFVPEAPEIFGFRHCITFFGDDENLIRAGCKVVWRYALLLEIADNLHDHYKLKSSENVGRLGWFLREWRKGGNGIIDRLQTKMGFLEGTKDPPEKRIGNLVKDLNLAEIEKCVHAVLSETNVQVHILIDKLDEGYEPDTRGIALLTGLTYAANWIKTSYENVNFLIFFRDNVFRAIERHDPDYSRELEGEVLRLHWDERGLLTMITNRLRVALNIEQEKSQKVWDMCTDRAVHGQEGFRRCLRLTLYRPRDLLVLLNEAFRKAQLDERTRIVDSDVDASAREMSETRLRDLIKEYDALIPGLDKLLVALANGKPELSYSEVCGLLDIAMTNRDHPNKVLQHMEILGSAEEAVRTLYSIGFLGLKQSGGQFVFCHDGKRPDIELNHSTSVLVHPCYWIAQNLSEVALGPDEIQQIYDDYEIQVTSVTPEIRNQRIGQFIGELSTIKVGKEDAGLFEDWCLRAVKMLFAASLGNAELHPNKKSTQRRDIVARNDANMPSWKRILEDYGSRQVIFEVKNYEDDLGGDEYRQMLSYLTGEYGKLGFIINRSDSTNVEKGRELDWVREMYHSHQILIIKLTAREISSWLSKIRSPLKHDAPDTAINGLLDRYVRQYVQIGHTGVKKGKKNPT